jgi:hypothetical protein
MKLQNFFYYLAICLFLFSACKKTETETPINKEFFKGYAQKGPFVNGSSITIAELNTRLSQTGKTYHSTISDNSGSFELQNLELASQYIELKADGYYFNEISGQTSSGTLTLYALVDIEDVNAANVNIITHLEKPRVEYLVKQQGMSFAAAKKQAQKDVLAIFGFQQEENLSEALNLTNNAVLLAISCILQGYISTGDMMELTADIIADIKQDGKLDNSALGSKLMNNAFAISNSLSAIRSNITKKYTDLGASVMIPNFESYIQSFLNSELYPQTVSITYPATGANDKKNILSDDITEVSKDITYSMKADVPKGFSLKVVIKDGLWFYESFSPDNWSITTYIDDTQSQIFTIKESGKSSDLSILFSTGTLDENSQTYVTVQYFENGATTPAKEKRLYLR